MKQWLIVSLLGVSTLAFAQAPSGEHAASRAAASAAKSQAHILNRAEFDALLAHPEGLVVIDVRRPDELTSIGGFPVYLSIQVGELDKQLAYIPRDRTIVTVSNHAGRAAKAADLLASKGFKVAGAVGAQNYEEQGGKLTKIAPKAPAAARASNSHSPG